MTRVLLRAAWITADLLPWVLLTAMLGCSRTNISEYVKALAQDQATFCLTNDLSSPWGNDKVLAVRTNLQSGNVQCTKDGLTVTSTPAVVPVGVQFVPTPPAQVLSPRLQRRLEAEPPATPK